MYLQITYLPGSFASQGVIDLAAKINDKTKSDPSLQLPPPYPITESSLPIWLKNCTVIGNLPIAGNE